MATCTPRSEHMTTRMARPHPYPHPGPGPNPDPGPSATRSGPRSGRCTRRLWTRPRKRPREGACDGVIGAWRGEREGGEADSVATARALSRYADAKPHPCTQPTLALRRRARRTREAGGAGSRVSLSILGGSCFTCLFSGKPPGKHGQSPRNKHSHTPRHVKFNHRL